MLLNGSVCSYGASFASPCLLSPEKRPVTLHMPCWIMGRGCNVKGKEAPERGD